LEMGGERQEKKIEATEKIGGGGGGKRMQTVGKMLGS